MKKKLRIILIVIVVVIFAAVMIPHLMFTSGLPADDTVFIAQEFYTRMGGAYEESSINTDRGTIRLETVFVDRQKAISEIKKELRPFLLELSIKYSLPELREETIDEYQEALFQYRKDNYRASQGAPVYKLSVLSYFCKTYKNSETNEQELNIKGIKSDLEKTLSYLFRASSTGYSIQKNAFKNVKLIVSDMLEYMKTTFELDMLTEDTIPQYSEHLNKVPEDPYALDKDILEKFFELYANQ